MGEIFGQEHPSYFAFPFMSSMQRTYYNISTLFFMDVLHWTLTANNKEKKCYGTSWVPSFGNLCKYLRGIRAAMNTQTLATHRVHALIPEKSKNTLCQWNYSCIINITHMLQQILVPVGSMENRNILFTEHLLQALK